ncbi:unnamed protein product, partial [Ixodes hexagonus]
SLSTTAEASSSCDRNLRDLERTINVENGGARALTDRSTQPAPNDNTISTVSDNSLISTSVFGDRDTRIGCSRSKKELILLHTMFALAVSVAFSLLIVFYPGVNRITIPVWVLAGPYTQTSTLSRVSTAPFQAAPPYPTAVAGHPISRYDVCWTDSCRKNGAYINALVSQEMDPCDNFFKFVCSRWRSQYENATSSPDDDLVYRLESDVYRLLDSFTPPSVRNTDALSPLKRVVDSCMSSGNGSDVDAVLELLSEVDLEGFPFTPPVRSSISAWKTAARVFSRTGAPVLIRIGISVHPFNSNKDVTTIDIPEPLLIIEGKTTAAYTRLVQASMMVLGKRFVPSAYTSEVVAFAQQLDKATTSREFLHSDERVIRLSKLKDLPDVRAYLHEIGEKSISASENDVLLLAPDFLQMLVGLVRKWSIHVILNFLGVHVLVRTSVFSSLKNPDLAWGVTSQLFGHSTHQMPRWRLCVRVAARSLPFLFLRASSLTVRTETDVVDSVLGNVLNHMKLHVDKVIFFDKKTCARAERILVDTHFAIAGPRWLSQKDKLASYLAHLPQQNPKYTFLKWHLEAVKAVQKAALRRRSSEVWPGSPFATDCWYDLQLKTVYIPTLLSSYDMPRVDDYGTFQLPRLGHRVTRCLLRMLIEGVSSSFNREITTRSFWSSFAKTSLRQAHLCLQEQLDVPPPMSLSLLEDHVSLKMVEGLYESVRQRQAADRDIRLPGAEDFSPSHLFFIYYGLGFCFKNLHDEEAEMQARRVNIPLRGSLVFQRLFNCRPTSPMGPLKKCAAWISLSKQ